MTNGGGGVGPSNDFLDFHYKKSFLWPNRMTTFRNFQGRKRFFLWPGTIKSSFALIESAIPELQPSNKNIFCPDIQFLL